MTEKDYKDNMMRQCPLTDVVWVGKNTDESEEKYAEFDFIPFNEKWKIGKTRYAKKMMPLTSFAVGHDYPCLDAASPFSYKDGEDGLDVDFEQTNEFMDSRFSSVEMQGGCALDYNTGQFKDTRYRDVHRGDHDHSMTFSLFDIQEESGIEQLKKTFPRHF